MDRNNFANNWNRDKKRLSRQLPSNPIQFQQSLSQSREDFGRVSGRLAQTALPNTQVYSYSTSNSKQSSFDKGEIALGFRADPSLGTSYNRLNPPISNLGRASSFESCPRIKSNSDLTFYQAKTNPSTQTGETNRKQFIGVKPSIEISTITEGGGYSFNSFESNESSDSHFLKSKKHDNSVSTSVPDMAHLNNPKKIFTHSNRSSGGRSLVYQPRSFNAPDTHDALDYEAHSRSHSSLRQMNRKPNSGASPRDGNLEDDFDYFCHIAKSHSNTNQTSGTPPTATGHTTNASRRESGNRLKPIRSQSIRSESPEHSQAKDQQHPSLQRTSKVSAGEMTTLQKISLVNSFRDDISSFTANPTRLSAPRNVLRRSATEDDQRYDSDRYFQGPCSSSKLQNTPLGAPITQEAVDADSLNLITYQLQIIGDESVGKTLLCNKLYSLANGSQDQDYDEEQDDEDTAVYVIKANLENITYHITIIDVPNQHNGDNLEIEFLQSVNAVILLYAVDSLKSFEFAKSFLKSVNTSENNPVTSGHRNNSTSGDLFASSNLKKGSAIISNLFDPTNNQNLPNFLVFLIANKSDLVRGRQVSTEDGKALARQYNAKFMEISSTLFHQIPEFLQMLIRSLREIEHLENQKVKAMYNYNRKKLKSQNLHSRMIKLEAHDGCNFKKFKKSNPKDTFTKFVRKHFTQKSTEE